MPEYPSTRLDRAIDAAIARSNADAVRGLCPTCLGTTRVYVDGEQRTCTACVDGKRRRP